MDSLALALFLVALLVVASLQLRQMKLVAHARRLASTVPTESDDPSRTTTPAGREGSSTANRRTVYMGAAAGILLRAAFPIASPFDLVLGGAIGAGFVHFVRKSRMERKVADDAWQLEAALPNAMERVVMGVTAGLDVLPAVQAAIPDEKVPSKMTGLLRKVLELSDRGLSFSQSLALVSETTVVHSVRHAFVHLGLAQEKGGELIRPLRELADATQLQFQERIEEEIAKLPVKATLPLLLTFTGLIVCFITIPLVQVASMTKKVSSEEVNR